jgi:hypothetical protein
VHLARNSVCAAVATVFLLTGGLTLGFGTPPSLTGEWEWQRKAQKGRFLTTFTLRITEDESGIQGVHSVSYYRDGVWLGEDGNQTPFVGYREPNRVRIEFDPQGTQPGYAENVHYKKPVDGRRPSLAEIRLGKGKILVWRLPRGPGIDSIPQALTLRPIRGRSS